MVTAIRIEMTWQRQFLRLATGLLLLPAAHAAEMEIYVTTGPDGIEIFSNLPRRPDGQRSLNTNILREKLVVATSTMPAHPLRYETEAGSAPATSLATEIDAPGKSFLFGD